MKKHDYKTIAAHVPLSVSRAVEATAKKSGAGSVSKWLAGLVAREVLAPAPDIEQQIERLASAELAAEAEAEPVEEADKASA